MKRRRVSRGTIRESLTNTGRFNKIAVPGSRADEDNSELDYADDNMMSEDDEDDMMDDEVTARKKKSAEGDQQQMTETEMRQLQRDEADQKAYDKRQKSKEESEEESEVTARIRRQDKLVSIPRHTDVKRLYAEASSKTAAIHEYYNQRILSCPGCGEDDQNYFELRATDGSYNTFECQACSTGFTSDVHGTDIPIEMVTSLPMNKRNLQFEQRGYGTPRRKLSDDEWDAMNDLNMEREYDARHGSSKTSSWDKEEGYMLGSDQFGQVWYSGGRNPMTQKFTFIDVEGQPYILSTDIYAAEEKLRRRLGISADEAIYNNKPFGWGRVTTSGKSAAMGLEDSLNRQQQPGEKMYTFIIDEDEDGSGEEVDIYASNDYDAEMYAKDAADEIVGAGRWTTISPMEPGGSGGQVYTSGKSAAMGDFNEDEYERMIALDPNNKDFGVDPAFLEELEEKHKFVDNSPFPSGSTFAPEARKKVAAYTVEKIQSDGFRAGGWYVNSESVRGGQMMGPFDNKRDAEEWGRDNDEDLD